VRNGVQLIAYADRLGGDLRRLGALLDGPLAGVFSGVHVLPFFRPYDGADAGFDPEDHTEVDRRLGSWDDVRALAEGRDVLADCIVNHVSADSAQFRDVRERGEASPHAGLFLTFGSVFPDGATEDDLLRLYRPRPGLPFTTMRLGDRNRLVWTTFTDRQVDIDATGEQGQAYLRAVVDALAAGGVSTVRLDAVGYAVKTAGTTSFMTPETYAFIDDVVGQVRDRGMQALVEIHADQDVQLEVARRVDWVYDFALPPLVLHALLAADAEPLVDWLGRRPANCVTVLDTHDGIGVVDVIGLLSDEQIEALVEKVHTGSGGTSRQATGWAASNVDLYQVNCTYYDALGADDDRYLAARLLQLFLPGVPQVYYVGLLAGRNDMTLLGRTGVGRDVNRHHFGDEEVTAALGTTLGRRLVAACRLRTEHPAFGGSVQVSGSPAALALRWERDEHVAQLEVDLRTAGYRLTATRDGVPYAHDDVLQVGAAAG
jgi:sucrose phosphorylase